jgi:hypothetical protein
MIPPVIRLNGKLLTRNSVSIRLNGVIRLTAVDSTDWSDEVPAELVQGMNEGGPPLGKAMGPYSCAASMGVYLDYAAAFEAAVLASDPVGAATGGGNLAACNVQLMIIAREDARVHATTLVNCSIKGRGTAVGNDGAALVKMYQLQPTIVLENGLSLVRMTPAL